MAKIKISCPHCGRLLQYDEMDGGTRSKCPHCKNLFPLPAPAAIRRQPMKRRSKRLRKKKKWVVLILFFLIVATASLGMFWPAKLHWKDRRPIGILMMASNFHSSPTNPRGWFNDPALDFTGTNGAQRFRTALLDYTDRSIAILKRTGAQGVIVWDLEGEEYPHKISYIGDPRLVGTLAPEMGLVVDDFFKRFRNAGLRVGLTIRPQQLEFDELGLPHQTQVLDTKRILLDKIDYARTNWGVSIFYVDSNGGIRRPDEAWQMRLLAGDRPDILLIPEHTYLPYSAFSAPYALLSKDRLAEPASFTRTLYPDSFQALNISDATDDPEAIAAARLQGDILLYRAWYWGPECQILENLAAEIPSAIQSSKPQRIPWSTNSAAGSGVNAP